MDLVEHAIEHMNVVQRDIWRIGRYKTNEMANIESIVNRYDPNLRRLRNTTGAEAVVAAYKKELAELNETILKIEAIIKRIAGMFCHKRIFCCTLSCFSCMPCLMKMVGGKLKQLITLKDDFEKFGPTNDKIKGILNHGIAEWIKTTKSGDVTEDDIQTEVK
eukprot:CAMPEP_0114980274 /NCGR_PEP_ID=MMETSP0216-20121206/4865_1 /TAXON_ID=223996 /ORGANISM="Protocruzia adherens, Strain Boccale" /LENGTH=161 /DNA_ID=CAMNT_0002341751 /DNA_START=51 /DNA_END=536 /DNA_ORIENTATION=-